MSQGQKEKIIQWAFLLAALFHDFGYGYFYRTMYDKKAERLYRWLQSLSQNSEPSCQSYEGWNDSLAGAFIKGNLVEANPNGSATDRRLTGFTRNTLTLNHSMASCLFTLYLKKMLKDARAMSPHLDLALEIAAEAILLHDMINKGNWCGIHKNTLNQRSYKQVTLASLLVCCDELAIWERRNLGFAHGSSTGIQLTLESPKVESIDLALNGNFEIRINWGGGADREKKKELRKDLRSIFRRKSYDPKNGFRVFGGSFFGRDINCNIF